jgi:Holliday junction resolvase
VTAYTNGAAFERRVMTALENDGYQCLRAAGSKGAADLIALKPGQTLLVQVKLTNPQLAPTERITLTHLAKLCGALPIVAWRTKLRGPIGFRELTGTGPKDHRPWTPDEAAA